MLTVLIIFRSSKILQIAGTKTLTCSKSLNTEHKKIFLVNKYKMKARYLFFFVENIACQNFNKKRNIQSKKM